MRATDGRHPIVDEAARSRSLLSARLLGGLAHEVKNPLNAMAINLEVLADKLREDNGGALPDRLAKNIGALKAQIARVDLLVRRASDFAQPRERAPGPLPVLRLIELAASLTDHDARRAGVTLEVSAPEELQVFGEEDVLLHALLLLVFAALPSVGRGGRLRLVGALQDAAVEVTGTTAGSPASLSMGLDRDPELAARLLATQGGALPTPDSFRVELALA